MPLKVQTLSGTRPLTPVPTGVSELRQGHGMLTLGQVGGKTQLPRSTEYPTERIATFPIGEHDVFPLVKVTGLQAHLRPLRAFHQYSKQTVQQSTVELAPSMQLGYPQILLLNRSVHRFEAPVSAAWPSGVAVAPTKATTPPLDILTARHTYLLV